LLAHALKTKNNYTNVFSGIIGVLVMEDGLVIVYTGKGKGKTTAALGVALRATGHGMKTCMIQFIKGSWHYGEMSSSKKLEPEFELTAIGKGFVGIMDDKSSKEDHKEIAREAVKISKEKILCGKYDIVILDEINYAVNLGLIPLEDVLEMIKTKPRGLTLILTGNHAKQQVIDAADLVTEMKEIKHPFQRGIRAKKGVDF
jgi:cob(I)alamin adenosyltransferase